MKLYASVTSERATKGQGGEYLDIEIQDSNKELIGKISVRRFKDDVGDGIKIFYTFADWVYPSNTGLIEATKGENQKGELCEYCHINKADMHNDIDGHYCLTCWGNKRI